MNEIQKARKAMRDAFERDAEFKEGYIANIAVLLYDRHGITDYNKLIARNAVAEDILQLIFYSGNIEEDKIIKDKNKKISRIDLMDIEEENK